MERLTHKIVYDNEHCQYMYDHNLECEVGTRLGELEDVLEKWHIEDLDGFIENLIAKKRELNDICWEMEKELTDLQHRLEVAEKALELAVGIANIKSNHFWTVKELKEKAEKELKGEKL